MALGTSYTSDEVYEEVFGVAPTGPYTVDDLINATTGIVVNSSDDWANYYWKVPAPSVTLSYDADGEMVLVDWSDNSRATSWRVYYGTEANPITIYEGTVGSITQKYLDAERLSSTEGDYDFNVKVVGYTADGIGLFTSVQTISIPAIYPFPSFTTMAYNNGAVTGTIAVADVDDFSTYKVYAYYSGDSPVLKQTITDTGASSLPISFTMGLPSSNTTLYVKVYGVDPYGILSEGFTRSVAVTAWNPPTGLNATPTLINFDYTVTWAWNSVSGATNYELVYGVTSNPTTSVQTTSTSNSSQNHIFSGTTVYAKVRAYHPTYGWSSYSNIVNRSVP